MAGFPHKGQRDTSGRPAPIRWLGMVIEAVGNLVFGADDRFAAQHGWQITARHGGLGRGYRDRRFGALHACSRCGGSGGTGGEPCAPCGVTGRVAGATTLPEGLLR